MLSFFAFLLLCVVKFNKENNCSLTLCDITFAKRDIDIEPRESEVCKMQMIYKIRLSFYAIF